MNPIATVLLIIITILFPPIGVFCVTGCGADLLINILLTVLGYLPGHIHAFYVEYIILRAEHGSAGDSEAVGVYSDRARGGYGTIAQG